MDSIYFRSRKNGIFTTGDGSLSQIFEVAPKPLHYILSILCKHEFIEKKTVSSQKQRCVVYIKRFDQKNETNLEKILNYLSNKKDKQEFTDVLREKFNLGTKQFKNVAALGEKQNVFKRITTRVDSSMNFEGTIDEDDEEDDEDGNEDTNSSVEKKKSKQKTKCVRLLRLTNPNASYGATLNNEEDEDFDENDGNLNDIETLCREQKIDLPIYTQIFKYIERCGEAGVSLKVLGKLFGFDFYKARRIGANLQTHPDVITLVKETERGKAKYQTIIMKKFLNTVNAKSSVQAQKQVSSSSTISATCELSVKNTENKPIQAIASERQVKRKQIVLDYLEKHKICSKFEIDKEIRRIEELEKQKGQIDAKTTKRMLLQLQGESKLRVFEFKVKEKTQVAVCLASINESDDVYTNYLNTFSRSFDFCINNKNQHSHSNGKELNTSNLAAAAAIDINKANIVAQESGNEFKLTKSYIETIIKKLEFSFNYAKSYGLVSKIQKAIVLHRFIHYILNFNKTDDAVREEVKATNYDFLMENNHSMQENKFNFKKKVSSKNLNYSNIKPPTTISSSTSEQDKKWLEKEYEIVNSCVPSACYSKDLSWKTFIPPLKVNESMPKSCLFISDILACMPLSVFVSIIAINYKIPGLLSLLKHPYKRHILIKDLPPEILAAFIYDRRYLQRILSILQLMACLNLISFAEHPTIHNQSLNRTVESQMLFASRQTYIRDTTENVFTKWSDLKNFDTDEFKKLTFKFDSDEAIVDYWKCLLNVSLNTYKFTVGSSFKESKKMRALLFKKACFQVKTSEIRDSKPMVGDCLGPGGYDSQLFLNSYANWTLPTTTTTTTTPTPTKSNSGVKDQFTIPSIDYEDKIDNVFSELTMALPFGILRGINSSSSSSSSKKTPKRKPPAKRKKKEDSEEEAETSDTEMESPTTKKRKILPYLSSPIKISTNRSKRVHKVSTSSQDISQSHVKKQIPVFKVKTKSIHSMKPRTKVSEFKETCAKNLVKKAKQLKLKLEMKEKHGEEKNVQTNSKIKSAAIFKQNSEQKRAVWNKEEDDLILLIKIASLYFLPNEKTIQFKIIHDIMNDLLPSSYGKKVKSFGRRMKVLLKSKLNRLYISNKLELCKQNDELSKLYSNVKLKRNSIANQNEQIGIYRRFILDIKSRLNTNLDDLSDDFKLPDTIDELYKKYSIKSQNDIFKQESFFKQPENDHEIVKSTLHSAIHVSYAFVCIFMREKECVRKFI